MQDQVHIWRLGSSQASAETATVASSIDAYNPPSPPNKTDACLTSTAQVGELNAEAAFDKCGLERMSKRPRQPSQHFSANSPPPTATCAHGPLKHFTPIRSGPATSTSTDCGGDTSQVAPRGRTNFR